MALLPHPMVGANVDMANLLATDSLYVRTDRGDLFDYAYALGLNAFRVTTFEQWGIGATSRAFTPAEWSAVAARARSRGIVLIPVVSLAAPQRASLAAMASGPATLQAEESDLIASADSMLGPGGLAQLASQGRMILDIGNEPSNAPDTVAMYQTVLQQLRTRYPGVPMTVGGWHADVPNGSPPRFNNPADGVPYAALEDVLSVHMYNEVRNSTNGRGLQNLPTDSIASAAAAYLAQVVPWAGSRPILVEEFGAASGLIPVASVDPTGQSYTASRQAAALAAMFTGIGSAIASGANVLGATPWILIPRGPASHFNSSDNGMALLFLQGRGQPLNPMAALGSVCSGAAAWPTGATLRCSTPAAIGQWVQQAP